MSHRTLLDEMEANRRIAELEENVKTLQQVLFDKQETLDSVCARLVDLQDDYRATLAEDCAPDERHCSCVPHLRRRVRELEDELDQSKRALDNVRYGYDGG